MVEWYQCWLYCPDHIIRLGSLFLEAVGPGEDEAKDGARAATLGDLLIAIRREMGVQTDLSGTDFLLVAARPDGYQLTRPTRLD